MEMDMEPGQPISNVLFMSNLFQGNGNQYKEVRHVPHPETGVDMNEMLAFAAAIGYSNPRVAVSRFLTGQPHLVTSCYKVKFPCRPNQKQNHNPATWACDAETLFQFGCFISQDFRNFAIKAGVLVAGGSEALAQAQQEIRKTQQQLPENHFGRAFGRHAEEVDRKVLPPLTSHNQAALNDPKYCKNRCNTADAFVRLRTRMQIVMPKAGRHMYSNLNFLVGQAVMGKNPKAFKEDNDIDQRFNAPDIMTQLQLHAREMLMEIGCRMLGTGQYDNTDGEQFLLDFEKQCQCWSQSMALFHGDFQDPTHLPEVREARRETLTIAHNRDVYNITGANATINIGK